MRVGFRVGVRVRVRVRVGVRVSVRVRLPLTTEHWRVVVAPVAEVIVSARASCEVSKIVLPSAS